jgi:tryptophan-rich sensory protein
MGVSLWLIWRKNQSVENNNLVPYIFFGVQLFLNFLWSGLFFGLRSPELALIDIMALWFAIGGTVVSFWQVDKFAALLLIPYWAWVTFAAVLNAAIRVLN